ncbi:MAG: MFS transporter [Burkholderiaceae bacterium]|nr:MFS transporter [Burkholderiaceae bacterium]
MAPDPARLRRAARSVRLAFFLSGAMFATWGVQVPAIKAHYGLGEQALAVALLAAGLGAIGVLAFAGRWVPRVGPRRLVALTGVICALLLAALLQPPQYAGLLALMAGFGMAGSLFDVAMNTAAARLEEEQGRPLMSGFHAFFSLGGMVGAAAGSAALAVGWSPAQHLGAAGGLAALLSGLAAWGMQPREARPAADAGSDTAGEAPRLSLPTGPLLLLGLLAALGLEAEGALYDWSVLFLVQERAAPAATAALAYAAFTGAMAAGRFAGDAVRARAPMLRLLQGSGLLAAAGMAVALLGGAPWVALLGFALVGLGLANVVPLLFVAATQVPGVGAAHGIAAVSSMGYAGLMVGPPLIGFIAEHSSLSVGLATVMGFALLMAACARRALAAVAQHARAADTPVSRG